MKFKRLHVLWLALVILLLVLCFQYYRKTDLATSDTIKIQGDATCHQQTEAALNYLKNRAPDYFTMVEKYIGEVDCVEAGSGINAFEHPPRFLAGRATREAGTEWYAGALVHDANHSKLFNDYKKQHPLDGDPPASVWTGENAERLCIEVQVKALHEAGAPQWVFDSLKKSLDSRYWEQGSRWW